MRQNETNITTHMVSQEIKQTTLNEIFKLLVSGITDSEIQEQLQLPRSTYYRYKQQLNSDAVAAIKSQKAEDYGGILETYEGRLKKILHHVLLRISDTSRISNRDLATLSSIGRDISAELLQCDTNRYKIMFPDKQQLPGAAGVPALIDSDSDDQEAFDSSGEHVKSTDRNPIV